MGEVGEVVELVQWLRSDETGGAAPGSHLYDRLKLELADVAGVALRVAAEHELDRNAVRFPVETVWTVAPECD